MEERTADMTERWWTGQGDRLPYNLKGTLRLSEVTLDLALCS